MKVKELISKLEQLDQDCEVKIPINDTFYDIDTNTSYKTVDMISIDQLGDGTPVVLLD